MDAFIAAVFASPLTPATLALTSLAIIIISFARGWIVSSFTVESLLGVQNLRIGEAIKRGDDYKTAWELSEKRGDILQALLDKTTTVGENVDKILSSLPVPRKGDTSERVS